MFCRKNSLEIELAKTRLDLMNLDSQLMEAIQQKIQLSQQLEQWQVGQIHFKLRYIQIALSFMCESLCVKTTGLNCSSWCVRMFTETESDFKYISDSQNVRLPLSRCKKLTVLGHSLRDENRLRTHWLCLAVLVLEPVSVGVNIPSFTSFPESFRVPHTSCVVT